MAVSRDRLTFLLQQIAGLCPANCRNEMFSGLKYVHAHTVVSLLLS
jgi:hypothetical protein